MTAAQRKLKVSLDLVITKRNHARCVVAFTRRCGEEKQTDSVTNVMTASALLGSQLADSFIDCIYIIYIDFTLL